MERLLPLAVAAACVAVVLVLPASTPDEHVAPAPTTTTTTLPPSLPPATVEVASVRVHSAGPPTDALLPEVEAEVRRTLEDYLRQASLEAIAQGRSGPGTAALFTATARLVLDGADRVALVDDGLGPVRTVQPGPWPVDLVALAGTLGEVGTVVATLDWRITGHAAEGVRVTVHRRGELTLVPDGDRWRIDGFELTVEADRTAPATTTTGAGGSGGGR